MVYCFVLSQFDLLARLDWLLRLDGFFWLDGVMGLTELMRLDSLGGLAELLFFQTLFYSLYFFHQFSYLIFILSITLFILLSGRVTNWNSIISLRLYTLGRIVLLFWNWNLCFCSKRGAVDVVVFDWWNNCVLIFSKHIVILVYLVYLVYLINLRFIKFCF